MSKQTRELLEEYFGIGAEVPTHPYEKRVEYMAEAEAKLDALIQAERIDELKRIDTANKDNGINFYFEDMKDRNNGWRTMRQYVPERIKQLQQTNKEQS